MADIIDEANEKAERYREQAIKRRAKEAPPPCGRCYNCGEDVKDGFKFCDADCRDDWQERQDRRKRTYG